MLQKQLKIASTNSPWACIREGLLSEGFLHLRFGDLYSGRLIFGGAYYWNFTVSAVSLPAYCRAQGGGGVLRISSDGDNGRIFLGFEIFNSGIFLR